MYTVNSVKFKSIEVQKIMCYVHSQLRKIQKYWSTEYHVLHKQSTL
jgi:hypothetical protein